MNLYMLVMDEKENFFKVIKESDRKATEHIYAVGDNLEEVCQELVRLYSSGELMEFILQNKLLETLKTIAINDQEVYDLLLIDIDDYDYETDTFSCERAEQ